jgi:hypothetical protein
MHFDGGRLMERLPPEFLLERGLVFHRLVFSDAPSRQLHTDLRAISASNSPCATRNFESIPEFLIP